MDGKLEKKCDTIIGLVKKAMKAHQDGDLEKSKKITEERLELTKKTVAEPQYVNESDKEIIEKAAYTGKRPLQVAAISKNSYGQKIVNERLYAYHKFSDRVKLGIRGQQNIFDGQHGQSEIKANHETLAKSSGLWGEYIREGMADFADLVKADIRDIAKASVLYTTNAGYGAEWIPEIWSRDLVDMPHLPHNLVSNLPQIKMAGKNYTYGAASSDPHFYVGAEQSSTDPTSRVTASDYTTTEVNFVAKKFESRVTLSTEEGEDAIFNATGVTLDKLRAAAVYDLEDAIINGDDSTTHMDTNITTSDDWRKAWKGLRRWEKDNDADVDLSTITLAKLAGMRASLGAGFQSINDLTYIGSPTATIAIGAADIGFKTIDQYGNKAFVLTGEVGKIAGVPYIESQRVYSNLDATGFYDGTTTTKTIVLLVYRPSVGVGFYKNLEVVIVPKAEYDLIWVIGRFRVDLQPMHAKSNLLVVLGYNFA